MWRKIFCLFCFLQIGTSKLNKIHTHIKWEPFYFTLIPKFIYISIVYCRHCWKPAYMILHDNSVASTPLLLYFISFLIYLKMSNCIDIDCTVFRMEWYILNENPSFNSVIVAASLPGFFWILTTMLCSQATLHFILNSHPSRKRWVFTPPLQPYLTPLFLPLRFPPPAFIASTKTPSLFCLFCLHPYSPSLSSVVLLFLTYPPSHPFSLSPRCWSIHSIPGRCDKRPPSSSIHPLPPEPCNWTIALTTLVIFMKDISSFFWLWWWWWGGACEDELFDVLLFLLLSFSSHSIPSLAPSTKVSVTPLAHLK